ncbi:Hypothetical protein NTJ_12110 [Nesidiocoris tenuis]|uniref:Uncharacterized protein n=1 Tax=Nesidiocoris tenuis TaxID=355587 RepID=A0ABN7B4F3_9HEMI|nr:Hypothetical protein NTJ_12110 [Nesidiocoris tenuis]
MSSISDIELLSNVLRNEKVVDAGTPITETEESLANKVIQLAIERANQVNAPQPSLRFGSTVPTEATTENSTTESLIVTPESSTNKTGKISLWVIEDENTTPLPSKSSTVDVDNPDVDVINALLSTPGIDQLSLREQLILADVLSSTVAYPPVSTTKKKRPKVTTTTPAPQFPILRALFGRSRWAQGRGLFGQGLTGGYQSFREQNQNFGGVQNENVASGTTASPTTEFGDNQFGGAGANDLPPETRQGLVGAAINVSRAVSQFMSYVFQGATQSFQNYLQTRTRSLATSIANGPIS